MPTSEWLRLFDGPERPFVLFAAAMLFAFGAAWGSFLNVVVYRLPRGKSLVWPPSACPRCGTGIAGGDNLPVFGWLKLAGKCRACRLPIAARYPLVEAFCGLLLLGLALVELASGGGNLPHRVPDPNVWRMLTHGQASYGLFSIFLAHAILLFALLGLALIGWDGLRVHAWRFWLWIGLPFVLAAAVWPGLLPVRLPGVPFTGWLGGPATALAGGALGAVFGGLLYRQNPAALGLALAGTFLGPFAVLPIGILARLNVGRLSAAGVFVFSAIYLAFWRQAAVHPHLPNPGVDSSTALFWLAMAIGSAGFAPRGESGIFQERGPADEVPPA